MKIQIAVRITLTKLNEATISNVFLIETPVSKKDTVSYFAYQEVLSRKVFNPVTPFPVTRYSNNGKCKAQPTIRRARKRKNCAMIEEGTYPRNQLTMPHPPSHQHEQPLHEHPKNHIYLAAKTHLLAPLSIRPRNPKSFRFTAHHAIHPATSIQ